MTKLIAFPLFIFGLILLVITILIHVFIVRKGFSKWTDNEKYMLYRGYTGGILLILMSLMARFMVN